MNACGARRRIWSAVSGSTPPVAASGLVQVCDAWIAGEDYEAVRADIAGGAVADAVGGGEASPLPAPRR